MEIAFTIKNPKVVFIFEGYLAEQKKMSHKLLFSTEIIFCSKLKTQSINITGFLSRELPDTKIHPHCCSLFGSDAEVYDPI